MTNQPAATCRPAREWPHNGRVLAVEASTADGKSSELLTIDVY